MTTITDNQRIINNNILQIGGIIFFLGLSIFILSIFGYVKIRSIEHNQYKIIVKQDMIIKGLQQDAIYR